MPNPRRLDPPVLRQLAGDRLGLGRAAQSVHSQQLVARTRTSDKVVQSICPYSLLNGGALTTRWSIFRAGFASARDPRYVVAPQRAGIERGARPGAARTDARRPSSVRE